MSELRGLEGSSFLRRRTLPASAASASEAAAGASAGPAASLSHWNRTEGLAGGAAAPEAFSLSDTLQCNQHLSG